MDLVKYLLLLSLLLLSSCASRNIAVDGSALEYEVKGQGEVVVLFDAGLLSGMEGWDSIWNALPAGITAIRFSRRGEGNSPACKGQLSISDYSADVESLLGALGINRPFIYASHSFGGVVSRVYAQDNPELVAAMLFVDPANPRDLEIIKTVDANNGPAEIVQTRYEDYEDGKGKWCFLDALWNKTPSPGFAEIGDVPITLIAGVKEIENPERIFDSSKARQLWGEFQADWVSQFPRGRAVVTEQSGHFVQDDEPELVLSELNLLIARLDQSQ